MPLCTHDLLHAASTPTCNHSTAKSFAVAPRIRSSSSSLKSAAVVSAFDCNLPLPHLHSADCSGLPCSCTRSRARTSSAQTTTRISAPALLALLRPLPLNSPWTKATSSMVPLGEEVPAAAARPVHPFLLLLWFELFLGVGPCFHLENRCLPAWRGRSSRVGACAVAKSKKRKEKGGAGAESVPPAASPAAWSTTVPPSCPLSLSFPPADPAAAAALAAFETGGAAASACPSPRPAFASAPPTSPGPPCGEGPFRGRGRRRPKKETEKRKKASAAAAAGNTRACAGASSRPSPPRNAFGTKGAPAFACPSRLCCPAPSSEARACRWALMASAVLGDEPQEPRTATSQSTCAQTQRAKGSTGAQTNPMRTPRRRNLTLQASADAGRRPCQASN
mmetsp:Transcript_55859/g.104761  ORF Transcript_55859/g.104761 Transcript_55859/m.104761 type:complete len:392 (-) Transcript_55859:881-2056(-)